MSHETSRFCLPEQAIEDRDKIVLVLDLDETLVYAREGPLFARPVLMSFLKSAHNAAKSAFGPLDFVRTRKQSSAQSTRKTL
jgi:hypothetical protein